MSGFQKEYPGSLTKVRAFWPLISTIAAIATLLLLWSGLSFILAKKLFPGPLPVLQQIAESWDDSAMLAAVTGQRSGLEHHLLQTVLRFGRFMATGILAGVLLLLCACFHKNCRKLLQQLTWLFNPIPPLLLLPIAHASGCPAIALEWIGGAFYPTLAFLSIGLGSLEASNQELTLLMRESGARRRWLALNIFIPTVEAAVLPSLKTLGAFTLGLTIVIEWMLSPDGLGRVMKYALSFNSGSLLLAAVLLVVLLAGVYETLIQVFTSWRLKWKTKASEL